MFIKTGRKNNSKSTHKFIAIDKPSEFRVYLSRAAAEYIHIYKPLAVDKSVISVILCINCRLNSFNEMIIHYIVYRIIFILS